MLRATATWTAAANAEDARAGVSRNAEWVARADVCYRVRAELVARADVCYRVRAELVARVRVLSAADARFIY